MILSLGSKRRYSPYNGDFHSRFDRFWRWLAGTGLKRDANRGSG